MDRTLQYLQLDFLQIFRLGKNKGVFTRKRKMPIEYFSTQRSSAKKGILKLCKDIINFHLNKNYFGLTKTSYNTVYIYFTYLARNILNEMNLRLTRLQQSILFNTCADVSSEERSFVFNLIQLQQTINLPRNVQYINFTLQENRLFNNICYTTGYPELLIFLERLANLKIFLDGASILEKIEKQFTENLLKEPPKTNQTFINNELRVVPVAQISFNNALNHWRENQQI
jgi:hypothetical protein